MQCICADGKRILKLEILRLAKEKDVQINIHVDVVEQDDFSKDIVAAFTESLHHIFLIGAGLMAAGLAAVLFIKNKQLRGGVKATASE